MVLVSSHAHRQKTNNNYVSMTKTILIMAKHTHSTKNWQNGRFLKVKPENWFEIV